MDLRGLLQGEYDIIWGNIQKLFRWRRVKPRKSKVRMTCRRPEVSMRDLLYKECWRPNSGMVNSDSQS